MKKKKAIVVGGGIAGLVSACLLAKKHEVTLIEMSDSCGGLLKSIVLDGFHFDIGTHIPAETGIIELDQILFSDKLSLNEIKTLKTGSFYQGYLNKNSQMASTFHLSQEKQAAIFKEVCLSTSPHYSQYDCHDIENYLIDYFGKTAFTEIHSPIVKKLQSDNFSKLSPYALSLFGLERIIITQSPSINELKKLEYINKKVAYPNYNMGQSGLSKYYPKFGGVQSWTNTLIKLCKEKGVKIITNSSVTEVIVENNLVRSIKTNDKQKIETDLLVWSAPSFFALKPLKLTIPQLTPPEFKKMQIHHLLLDSKYLIDNHYVYNFDPEYFTFRTTLYNNFNSNQSKTYQCSVETFGTTSTETIIKELKKSGIISNKTNVINSTTIPINNGFPILTKDYLNNLTSIQMHINEQASNIYQVGRGNNKDFFMRDILKTSYNLINSLNGE